MRTSTLALAAIAALAVALPTTPSWAGKGPYWNCYADAPSGSPYPPPQTWPHWTSRAQAIRNVLRECRRASGGRCKIYSCFHESGDPNDPGCKHCVLPRAARPSPYR